MNVFTSISSVFPPKTIRAYKGILIAAGREKTNPRVYVGFMFLISILLTLVTFLLMSVFLDLELLYILLTTLFVFALVMALSYVRPMLQADSRATRIEKVLPDALQLISSNIRAGMTIDKALWLCAKPEFGDFEVELRRMASETLGGRSLYEALERSANRVRSGIMDRAFLLLRQGIQLGGEIANLLTEIASDIRTTQALRKEIDAATSMYTIFIIFASVLAAPALFAVSTFYVESTTILWGASQIDDIGGLGEEAQIFELGGVDIKTEEVQLFALACIGVTTFFGALTIGMIKYGRVKRGIKYVPFFVLTALGVYLIGYTVVRGMFSSILF